MAITTHIRKKSKKKQLANSEYATDQQKLPGSKPLKHKYKNKNIIAQ